jgi:hypothetical protein
VKEHAMSVIPNKKSGQNGQKLGDLFDIGDEVIGCDT